MPKETEARLAYLNRNFITRPPGRPLRILSEYLEPDSRFDHYHIADTIVFMGSARTLPRAQAEAEVAAAKTDEEKRRAGMQLEMSEYYETARELAGRFTKWSKELNDEEHRFVVCTGGGPGIMQAANQGASEERGMNIGMAISIPNEEAYNSFITRELAFHFHYFFMRKFWFAYLAKAIIFFPGGFGTLDEMFELLTLLKTKKISKPLPVVIFGTGYWNDIINFDALIRYGNVDPEDRELFLMTDSVDEAFNYITSRLTKYPLAERGGQL